MERVAQSFQAAVVGVFTGGLFVVFGKPLFAAAVFNLNIQVHGFAIGLQYGARNIQVHNYVFSGGDPDSAPGAAFLHNLSQLVGEINSLGIAHFGEYGVVFVG